MSLTVFLAVILAAFLHAGWNAIVKGGADKGLAMTAVVLGHVPCALASLAFVPLPAHESWPWRTASEYETTYLPDRSRSDRSRSRS